jgi:hypothetical protein
MQTSSAEMLWVYVALDVSVHLCSNAHANSIKPIDQKIQEINNKILQQIKK